MDHPTRACDVCQTPYQPMYWGEKRKSRTCSRACMALLNRSESAAATTAQRLANRSRLQCMECGVAFAADRPDARYCSRACRLVVRRRAWPRKHYSRSCGECGAKYETTKSTSRLCSQRCRRRRHERLNPGAKRVADARREGIISAGHISERDWRRLLERHRHQCAYCESSRQITMDHVVPLSRGGKHTIGNVVPACSHCNSTKNSRFVMEWKARR